MNIMPDKLMNEQPKKSKLPRLSNAEKNQPAPNEVNLVVGAGAADSGGDTPLIRSNGEIKEQRSQLRAAIKSAHTNRLHNPDELIQQAQELARKGDKESKEQAVQLFSQAVA